ncbi:MAG: prolyl oligopeptidase family serine peptidase, partial [Caldimonas sp.]
MRSPSIERCARTAVRALLAGLAGLLAACADLGPPRASAGAAAGAEQRVAIASRDVDLTGVLFTPAGDPLRRERRPAIVLMHGCGGMVDARGVLAARHRDWAERFARWGYVTIVLDSFGPRGLGRICEMKDRPIHPWKERTVDAYAAAAWLAARGDVDPNALFLLGWSNGGATVLSAVRRQAPGRPDGGPGFRAAVAWIASSSLAGNDNHLGRLV